MVGFDGKLIVIDFGLAAIQSENLLTNAELQPFGGSWGLRAPEMDCGHYEYLQADVFAMGMVSWSWLPTWFR